MIDKNLITEFFKNEQVIFGSENELVLNFAFYVRTRFSEAKLQFECPFNLKYMKQSNAEGNYEQHSYLDMLCTLENEKIAFEFKYHTALFSDEGIELKDHIARDVLRFAFRRDVFRVERYIDEHKANKGFAILLTNDSALYNTNLKGEWQDKNYRFQNKMPKVDNGWHTKNDVKTYQNYKEQDMQLHLKRDYEVHWADYLELANRTNGHFMYCIVEV